MFDAFGRCFLFYFYGIDIPRVAEGDLELLNTKQFREWLKEAWQNGELERHPNLMNPHDLMKKFWDTVREQMEAHHGGKKWVGTGGQSPFGHSGFSERGVRVFGPGRNFSALKVIGDRNYVDYSDQNTLSGDNIRQAIESLKHLRPDGALDQLNIDKTIYETAKNGGEIDLVFEKDLRDKLEVIVMLDNGGTSMTPYVRLTKQIFSKMKNQFKKFESYYFHNTIYSVVYKDARRTQPLSVYKLLERNPDTRIFIVGDATMAPEELVSNYGAISWHSEEYEASLDWLQRIADKFKHVVWLNPIPAENWRVAYGSYTLNKISEVFHMQDMSLGGIKRAVEYMNTRS